MFADRSQESFEGDSVMQVFKARNMLYGLLSRSEVSYRDW